VQKDLIMVISGTDNLMDIVKGFTNSKSVDEVRHWLNKHPDLQSDKCLQLLERLLATLKQRDDVKNIKLFQQYYDLLVQVREVGTEQAIADRFANKGQSRSTELAAIINELVNAQANIEDRIALIARALSLVDEQQDPLVWGSLQGELGESLSRKTAGDPAENIDRAICAYQESASVLSRTVRPVLWAITMNNVAALLVRRMHGDRVENLDRALQFYRHALSVTTSGQILGMMTQESQDTLVSLATGSQRDLEKAIDTLKRVLNCLDELGIK
jgi:hypothetical protein